MAKNKKPPVILWFRQDLRLSDNPALIAAAASGQSIIPLYILDDVNSDQWRMGEASRWWLHQSLDALNRSLDGKLCFESGDAQTVLGLLIEATGASAVFWNRCYEPWRIGRDKKIKQWLSSTGIMAKSFNGTLLFEPQTTLKADGTPYKVFTPFYKKALQGQQLTLARPEPDHLQLMHVQTKVLDDLRLLPQTPWFEKIKQHWQPGEAGAVLRLEAFFDGGLEHYREGRDYPALDHVSRLSPHLHFGEISPLTVWHAANSEMRIRHCEADGEHFLRELAWREFSYSLLYYFPDLPKANLQKKFDVFPWRNDAQALACWQRGQTGYPIVDAGMRELWQTGFMHNRVRMIVGSFLVKNLLLHWHHGEAWFWDTLLDADLASNSASWQWIAGCGADAAPYFRIFNPVSQGQKFDTQGHYVRKYVPELSGISDQYIHQPWLAPESVLIDAGIELGNNYPYPIVDLKMSRERALEAFRSLKNK